MLALRPEERGRHGAAEDAEELVKGLQDGELELRGTWRQPPIRRMITIMNGTRTLLELEVVGDKIVATYREEDLNAAAVRFVQTLAQMTVGPIVLRTDDWVWVEERNGYGKD